VKVEMSKGVFIHFRSKKMGDFLPS